MLWFDIVNMGFFTQVLFFFVVFICFYGSESICHNQPKYVVIDEKVSQFGATHICQLFGMELISIQNQTKNEDILNKIQQKGIKGDTYLTGMWTSGDKKTGSWKWSDGSHFHYTNWQHGEPNNHLKNESCLQMLSNGRWNDHPCDWEGYFVCERSKTTVPCCGCSHDLDAV